MTEQIRLIGTSEPHVGTVKRYCHNCQVAVYVQIENVPLVENSQGSYSCVKCAIGSGETIAKFLHRGKRFDQPTGKELADIIRDVIKRGRGL